MTSDKDISSFDRRLADQVRNKWEKYKIYRIDLTDVHTDHEINLAGNFLVVESVSNASVTTTIKLDGTRADPIELELQTQVRTVFTKLYLTNTAQTDQWIEILVGCDFEIDRPTAPVTIETQGVQVLTNVAADTNTVGPDVPCSAVFIKADVANVGVVWVDFRTPAVQNACLPFDPGDWSKHYLPNLNLVNANFEIANERLLVVPEG